MKYETFRRPVPVCAPDMSSRPVVEVRVPFKYDVDAASRASALVSRADPDAAAVQRRSRYQHDREEFRPDGPASGECPDADLRRFL